MRADAAIEKSMDGFIYFNGGGACLMNGALHWTSNMAVVSLSTALADNWQPSKLIELCEACKEARRLKEAAFITNDSLMAAHLRKWHCSCKKEG